MNFSLYCDRRSFEIRRKRNQEIPRACDGANQAGATAARVSVYSSVVYFYINNPFRKKNATSEEPMFECLALLASAVGPNLTKLLHDVLDLIFEGQLTETLVAALVAIARHIPPLLRTIQIRLLDMISIILSGQVYKPLGAPPQYARPDIKDSAPQVLNI